ncbi:MAG: ABC transporter substrate-binding protein, partial [Pseudomonadota bacterium]
MKLKHLLGATALAAVPLYALAADLAPCENCGDEMTIVSWGGAYSASQQNAYHTPYSEATGVTIVNDESSAEAVAKLRAMNEA